MFARIFTAIFYFVVTSFLATATALDDCSSGCEQLSCSDTGIVIDGILVPQGDFSESRLDNRITIATIFNDSGNTPTLTLRSSLKSSSGDNSGDEGSGPELNADGRDSNQLTMSAVFAVVRNLSLRIFTLTIREALGKEASVRQSSASDQQGLNLYADPNTMNVVRNRDGSYTVYFDGNLTYNLSIFGSSVVIRPVKCRLSLQMQSLDAIGFNQMPLQGIL